MRNDHSLHTVFTVHFQAPTSATPSLQPRESQGFTSGWVHLSQHSSCLSENATLFRTHHSNSPWTTSLGCREETKTEKSARWLPVHEGAAFQCPSWVGVIISTHTYAWRISQSEQEIRLAESNGQIPGGRWDRAQPPAQSQLLLQLSLFHSEEKVQFLTSYQPICSKWASCDFVFLDGYSANSELHHPISGLGSIDQHLWCSPPLAYDLICLQIPLIHG